MPFDGFSMNDLGYGDPFMGDSGYLDNFAFGDTSDTSMMGEDPYNTSASGLGGYGGGEYGGGSMGGMPNFAGMAPGLIQGLAGYNGFLTSQEGVNLSRQLIGQADPWGTSGGRAQAGQGLRNMLSSPMNLPYVPGYDALPKMPTAADVANMPGYQAGIDAVMRGSAAHGYLGSGNLATELMQYGGNMWMNDFNAQQQIFQDKMSIMQGNQSVYGDWLDQERVLAGAAGAHVQPTGNAAQYLSALGQAQATANNSRAMMGQGAVNAAQGGGGGGGDDGFGDVLKMAGTILPFFL